jgi:hypothetical protein
MSVEVSAVLKFLWIPVLTVFAFFAKSYFASLEKKNESLSKKQAEIEKNIMHLEMELMKNYYDKQEIKEHIVVPLMDRFTEVDSQVKAMSGMMTDIHSDMAILKYKILGEELKKQ